MRLYQIKSCYFELVLLKDSALSCLGVYCAKLFHHIYNNSDLLFISMRGKKMNKDEIEKFDVCYEFDENMQFLIPLVETKFVNISHLVFGNYFVIFIYYNKNSYGDRTPAFIQRVIKDRQHISLSNYGWVAHHTSIYECLAPDFSDFFDQVQIKIRCKEEKRNSSCVCECPQ